MGQVVEHGRWLARSADRTPRCGRPHCEENSKAMPAASAAQPWANDQSVLVTDTERCRGLRLPNCLSKNRKPTSSTCDSRQWQSHTGRTRRCARRLSAALRSWYHLFLLLAMFWFTHARQGMAASAGDASPGVTIVHVDRVLQLREDLTCHTAPIACELVCHSRPPHWSCCSCAPVERRLPRLSKPKQRRYAASGPVTGQNG